MESNKLIAEFEELPTEVFKSGIVNYHKDGAWYEEHELSYNVCWKWLMPVVKKCLDIYHIEQKNDDLNFSFYDCMGDRDRTYKLVVEFIKEYNNGIN